jgi:4-hydroxy-2-oxoheptanedioate aldolase
MHFMVAPSILWFNVLQFTTALVPYPVGRGAVTGRVNKFIERLESGVVAFGEIVHPELGLAQRVGDSDLDWVWYATEHTSLDFPLLANCLHHMVSRSRIRATGDVMAGPTPMIGLPSHAGTRNPWMVMQALDYGFMAIHQARVQSAADVTALVRAARYPQGQDAPEPDGQRGYGPMGAPRYWGCASVSEYLEKADVWPLDPDGEILLLVTIEDAAGLRNIDEIVKVPGLGGVIFGTSDGTMSRFGRLGQPVDQQWTAEADRHVLRAARNAGIAVGTAPGTSDESISRAIEQGYTFIIGRGENYVPFSPTDVRVRVPHDGRAVRPVTSAEGAPT